MASFISLAPFHLAGIEIRTSNLDGQSVRDIGKLWGDFFAQDLASIIQGKLSNEIICVYTDYESDVNGPYTTVLGFAVEPGIEQPAGISKIVVDAGPSLEYASANAEPQTMQQTWMKIWGDNLDRAYRADYDLYCADGTAKTFVSVLSKDDGGPSHQIRRIL